MRSAFTMHWLKGPAFVISACCCSGRNGSRPNGGRPANPANRNAADGPRWRATAAAEVLESLGAYRHNGQAVLSDITAIRLMYGLTPQKWANIGSRAVREKTSRL